MTELFKLKSKEQALKEIDRRLIEAMKPQPQSEQLLSRFREITGTRGKQETPKYA